MRDSCIVFRSQAGLRTKYEFLTTKMSNSDTKQIYKIICQIFQPNYADNNVQIRLLLAVFSDLKMSIKLQCSHHIRKSCSTSVTLSPALQGTCINDIRFKGETEGGEGRRRSKMTPKNQALEERGSKMTQKNWTLGGKKGKTRTLFMDVPHYLCKIL